MKHNAGLRRGFTVFITFAALFVVAPATLIVYQQLDHLGVSGGDVQRVRGAEELGRTLSFSSLLLLVAAGGVSALFVSHLNAKRKGYTGRLRYLRSNVSNTAMIVGLELVAALFVLPISYRVAAGWLEGFPSRITIGPGVFLLTGLLLFIISTAAAVITTSVQAVRLQPPGPDGKGRS